MQSQQTTQIEEEPGEAAEKPKLFEGTTQVSKSWWILRIFFSWVTPLMAHAQKYDELAIENYGNIREMDKVDYQIEKLRASWASKVAGGPSKNALIFAIFKCYKWNLLYLMFCNFFSICLTLAKPIILY